MSEGDASALAARRAALLALYHDKQEWIRHDEGRLTRLSTTATLAMPVYISEADIVESTLSVLFLAPTLAILFTLWFVWWSDREIRSTFRQIVTVEKGLVFFDITVDAAPVLPSVYESSDMRMRPVVRAGYALQIVSAAVLLLVAIEKGALAGAGL